MILRCLLVALLASAFLAAPGAFASPASVPTTWRLLDYIAVDYPEAVQDGAVVNQLEYDEMLEFSATAAAAIAALPGTPARPALEQDAKALQQAIADKATAAHIAAQARALAAALVQAYPIPLKPASPPDYQRGEALYATLCSSCHGASGNGDGPASEGLDPPPIAFTDRARADERSVFALYQVITQGLEGTSMPGYSTLPDEDRWALATYVGAMAYPDALAEAGRQRLAQGPLLGFDDYVAATPATVSERLGSSEDAAAIVAYLRRHPAAVQAQQPTEAPLATARSLLAQAVAAYREGDAAAAKQLALSAYLDGFEPVEPLLAARDQPLMVRIESAMAQLRGAIADGVDAEALQARADSLDGLFAEAEGALSQQGGSALASFVAAFTILLREGLEALLVVIAMITLLRRAERSEMLPWVHGGWLAALAAGVLTWALATWVITVSGASRELSEGFGSLLAAVVLVWVGIWMHGKSQAGAWQRYVREKLGRALDRKSGIFLLALVFIVVYREVFETILFYSAIWGQGDGGSVLGGALAAAAVLVAIAVLMLRFSRRLPIGQFFRYSSILIAVLAVVLIGKGVSALQEAGYLPISWFEGAPRVEVLGLYPTAQGIGAQLGVALVLVVGFLLARRAAPVAVRAER